MDNLTELQKAGLRLIGCLDGSIPASEDFCGIKSVSIIGNRPEFLYVVNYGIAKRGMSGLLIGAEYKKERARDKRYLFLDMEAIGLGRLGRVYEDIEIGDIEPRLLIFIWPDEKFKYKNVMKWNLKWLGLSNGGF